MIEAKTTVENGLVFERDVALTMSDGTVLRANVFRPEAPGRYPVVMAMGAYGKDVHFEDAFNPQWRVLKRIYPELDSNGSTGRYLRWEVVDPERWVPDGFVVIQVDSRGTGRSEGYLDPFGPVETRDFYEWIEWAGVQDWSNGKVGLIGVSYLAIKQWQVAALNPPHLAAIVPWEGSSEFFRDGGHHGGILSNSFTFEWWPRQVLANQYGSGDSKHVDRITGERTTGPSLSADILEGSRANHPNDRLTHSLDDAWNRARAANLPAITVPLLSAANWGGAGMHMRGNFEGFQRVGSTQKWMFAHIGTHYESFYLPHYVAIQKRFFNHFLRGDDNGWDREPPVQLAIRHVDGTAEIRKEYEWPLARTQRVRRYLDARESSLVTDAPAAPGSVQFQAMQGAVSFTTAPFDAPTEFTGPVWLRLWISSTTRDADIFAVLELLDPSGEAVTFVGAHERVPMAQGWLRASRRKIDPARGTEWRPWHTHDEVRHLEPGEITPLDIEIWPTSMVFPKGWRLRLTVQGHDYIVTAPGRMRHDHPLDRPVDVFGGVTTIHTGGEQACYLVLPQIPVGPVDTESNGTPLST